MKLNTIIITTPEELQGLITTSVRNALSEQNLTPSIAPVEYLNVQQAATFLNLAPQTIYGFTAKNLIPHIKGAKKLLFVKSDLEKWMVDGTTRSSISTDSNSTLNK